MLGLLALVLSQNLVPAGIDGPIYATGRPLAFFEFAPASGAGLPPPCSPPNILLNSEQFDTFVAATAATGGLPTVTANAALSPTGTLTADRVQVPACSGATGASVLYQDITVSPGATYTQSAYVQGNGSAQTVSLYRYNITSLVGSATLCNVAATGYTRCTNTWVQEANTTARYGFGCQNDSTVTGRAALGAADVFAWGGMVNTGATAVQYSATTSTAAGPAVAGAKGESVTWTRASGAFCTKSASESNIANGDLVFMANAQPRVMSLGGPLGVLVEGARTNNIFWSQGFENAYWTKTNATVTADFATAPDGTLTADRIQFNSTTGLGDAIVSVANPLPVATNTVAVYLRNNAVGADSIEFMVTAGMGSCFTCNFDNTKWTRCVPPSFAIAGGHNVVIGNFGSTCGSGSRPAKDVLVWQIDGQNADHISSPIPTTSAAGARSAESGSVLLSGITPATSGSMAATVNFAGHLWSSAATTDSAALNLTATVNVVGTIDYLVNSTTFAAFSGSQAAAQTVAPLGVHRYAIAWTGTSVSTYFDISTTASGTWTAPLNTQLTLQFGDYNSGHQVDSVVSGVKYDSSPTVAR